MKNFRDNNGGFGAGKKREKPTFEHKSWGVDRGQVYGSSRDKPLYKATCGECGKQCEVPFRPSGDKPVFCTDCFNKKRDPSDSRGAFNDRGPKRDFNDRHAPRQDFSRPSDSRAPYKPMAANTDETKKQLSDISFKLDRLISAIEKMATVATVPVAKAEVKKAAVPVVQKVVAKKAAAPKKAAVKKAAVKKKK